MFSSLTRKWCRLTGVEWSGDHILVADEKSDAEQEGRGEERGMNGDEGRGIQMRFSPFMLNGALCSML